jgi:outer membrane immunogenic protein
VKRGLISQLAQYVLFRGNPMITRRLVLALGALSVGSVSTMAADMYGTAPALFSRAPAPLYDWTGFYVGGSAGGGFSGGGIDNTATSVFCNTDLPGCAPNQMSSTTAAAVPLKFDTKPSGFIAGGQIGYNYQMGGFLLGVEADYSGDDIKGSNSQTVTVPVPQSSDAPLPFSSVTIAGKGNQKLDYFGTVRGRVGVLPVTRLLVYATAGLAYGHVTADTTLSETVDGTCYCGTFPTASSSFSSTRWGWTAGAGLEWMFAPHWSLRGEYLYYDLGSVTNDMALTLLNGDAIPFTRVDVSSTVDVRGSIARGGINYRF